MSNFAWWYFALIFHHHHHQQSLNCEGRWGTTDDFATSFHQFSLFPTALWDLPNSRPVHSLMLSSHLFLCPPCLLPPFTVPCKMALARPDERETWPYHCSFCLWSSAVRVQDSEAYRKLDVTRERISRILELRELLLSIQTGFSLVNAAVACAILESISGLEPSSL